jgi:hypothetical protein
MLCGMVMLELVLETWTFQHLKSFILPILRLRNLYDLVKSSHFLVRLDISISQYIRLVQGSSHFETRTIMMMNPCIRKQLKVGYVCQTVDVNVPKRLVPMPPRYAFLCVPYSRILDIPPKYNNTF